MQDLKANSSQEVKVNIRMNGEQLEEVSSVKYLDAIIHDVAGKISYEERRAKIGPLV